MLAITRCWMTVSPLMPKQPDGRFQITSVTSIVMAKEINLRG